MIPTSLFSSLLPSFPPSPLPSSFSPATEQAQSLNPFILHPHPRHRNLKGRERKQFRKPSAYPPPPPWGPLLLALFLTRTLVSAYEAATLPLSLNQTQPLITKSTASATSLDKVSDKGKTAWNRPPHHPRHPHELLYRAALLQGALAAAVGGGQGRVEGGDAGGG